MTGSDDPGSTVAMSKSINNDLISSSFVEINNGKRIVPTIIFEDGSILLEPTNKQLAEKIGLN